ncbi:glycine--tRNA ligase [Candidatus Kaiserbacteria bacterium RIFCSPHIGHO2_02_FULL_49_34]|uniref:glycine--tRNA ligase n=1 Tax=Candidatus Kaiserbacteria bacterium RIFCSPHIGHO2_02_FULL_49_34 TaxID=1798491 RepID=A0A1F6DID5_9BACT|nr:MAG: glycine--tRNA ligase [Candidatus Kaiserbacteria bacterium RIFCSPHIGHO2_02_FULL_49_34]
MKYDAHTMEKLVALAKRRGFLYAGSEIYGGLAGAWDYGPLGVMLKKNITETWWKQFVTDREDMYGVDAAILMNPRAWVASGHVAGFSDPLVEDLETQKRYRADHLLEEAGVVVTGMSISDMDAAIKEKGIKSPEGNTLGEVRQFNMMLKTSVGAIEDSSSVIYLRPETAGGMFVNFKNIVDTMAPKMPFGLAQIGKAFRNEIAPRDFIFRVRELEQMEVEYFVHPSGWERAFEEWREIMWKYVDAVGLPREMVHELEVAEEDRAHYSKRTIDFEFDFPFGRKELYGLAYRTDFDLSAHASESKQSLTYFDEATKERFVPHVIEPSLGVGRTMLAVLAAAYTEEEMDGETRVVLKLNKDIAPYRACVSPLLKNKPELVAKSREVYTALKKQFGNIAFDDNGNIGKRYRRQDEIGTPYCIVIDFDTLGENGELLDTVTVRNRDTGAQERVKISELANYIA